MRLNVYRREWGKPMVYSMESAVNFLLQTKQDLHIYLSQDRKIAIRDLCVKCVHTSTAGMIGIDFVEWEVKGNDAVKWVYRNRKLINSRFKD